MRQTLQPIDVAVGLSIALRRNPTFAALAEELTISPSTAHQAVKRLLLSGLVRKAAPIFEGVFDQDIDQRVRPSALGFVGGGTLEPLIPSAPTLATRHPARYDPLTLVDAIRVGNARDREVAGALLSERLDAVAA